MTYFHTFSSHLWCDLELFFWILLFYSTLIRIFPIDGMLFIDRKNEFSFLLYLLRLECYQQT